MPRPGRPACPRCSAFAKGAARSTSSGASVRSGGLVGRLVDYSQLEVGKLRIEDLVRENGHVQAALMSGPSQAVKDGLIKLGFEVTDLPSAGPPS